MHGMDESQPDKPRNVIDPREFTPEAMAAVVSEWLAEKPAAGVPPANEPAPKKREKPDR
jgi:hypothetical protein